MQSGRCSNDPRSAAVGDAARRVADYFAGYAEATADKSEDAETQFRLPRE
jgi:hypothetical protein